MLKYLLMKNVKTDSDYKKSQLMMYAITMVLMIATMIALYMTAENLDFAFGIIIGAGGVILVFSVIFLRELLNPVKLHAARIKATDERRKQLEQEAWTNIGAFMMILLGILMIVTSCWKPVTFDFSKLAILFYAMLFYRVSKLRK
ncbi:MAG: hypothetical protein WAZ61_05225 [Lactococcus chungangensis]